MFAKRLIIGCLLLSSVACMSAMDSDVNPNDGMNSVSAGSLESDSMMPVSGEDSEMAVANMASEAVEAAPVESRDAISSEPSELNMASDEMGMNGEQAGSMKKKMAPAPEMAEPMVMDSEKTEMPSNALSLDQESTGEESQASSMTTEDKVDTDTQLHDNSAQGVFESMSREEEGESFPG